jgi:pentatricopeptide repeat protein
MKQWPSAFPDPLPQYILAAEQGETAKAEASLRMVVKRISGAEMPGSLRRTVSHALIPYLAEHGKPDLAMQLFSQMAEFGEIPEYDWVMLDPRLRPIRDDARFKAVVAQSRARFDELRVALDEARTRGELPAYLDAALTRLLGQLQINR